VPFDTETTKIEEARRWMTPAYVLGAASDGHTGYFITRNDVVAFLKAHDAPAVPMVMHNAAFDLAVLQLLDRSYDIYDRVEKRCVWDTQLLHQLLTLGTAGHPARGRGQATLEHCCRKYLDVALPKDLVDSDGDDVRLSYDKWLQKEFTDIEPIYLDYLGQDVLATWQVYQRLDALLCGLRESVGVDDWGYIDRSWLGEQTDRWGPQTHHIQLQASIVLGQITKNGLHVDASQQTTLTTKLEAERQRLLAELRKDGFIPGENSGKALQEILRREERKDRSRTLSRTSTGKYATSEEALQEWKDIPFIQHLLEYKAISKLLSTFLDKMSKGVLHPSFATLLQTGRTSSFGDINAQNLPRNDDVRSCIVPAAGNVFVAADYAMIELGTLAQSVMSQLRIPSEMGRRINEGVDLHRFVASQVLAKPLDTITPEERQKAKAINFGKPGGMGNASLRQYAKASYGQSLSEDEVAQLSQGWLECFPEMRTFLSDTMDVGLELAKLLDLSAWSYYQSTGDRRYLRYHSGTEDQPAGFLGGMCLCVAGKEHPRRKKDDTPYSPEEINYFWEALETGIEYFAKEHHVAIREQRPSLPLRMAVMRAVGRAPVFTLTGRLRANASYCQRRNTMFQGLAADGAKLALWKVWRAGYRIVNFIHDEILVEVSKQDCLESRAEQLRELMKKGMREVVPEVKVEVEYAAMERWYKSAETVRDDNGRLIPWRPTTAACREMAA